MQHMTTKPVTATATGTMALAVSDFRNMADLLPLSRLVTLLAVFLNREGGLAVVAGAARFSLFHICHSAVTFFLLTAVVACLASEIRGRSALFLQVQRVTEDHLARVSGIGYILEIHGGPKSGCGEEYSRDYNNQAGCHGFLLSDANASKSATALLPAGSVTSAV